MKVPKDNSLFHTPLESDGRQRDVFPLPRVALEEPFDGNVCRAVRQRVLSHHEKMKRVNMAIHALNSLYYGGGSRFPKSAVVDYKSLPLVQKDAIADIICKVGDLGPPPPACRTEALKVLRAMDASGYAEPDVSSGSTVPMDLGLLSLPSGAVAGVDLLGALKGPVYDMVENYNDFLLRDASDWIGPSDNVDSMQPFNDPLLSTRQGYLGFLKKLYDSGVISFDERCQCRVGAFTVAKKPKLINGVVTQRQRLVLDCRQSNQLFRTPPQTRLGSLATLADSVLDNSDDLFIAGADIRDCFYAVTMPQGLRQYFGLASDISDEELRLVTGGKESGFGHKVVPVIKVLPMGFSWSFFLVQHLHTEVSLEALNLDDRSLFLEGQPSPLLKKGAQSIMPYCDNIHCLSVDRHLCQAGKDKLASSLESLGFELHEHAEASDFFETLGGVVEGKKGIVRANHRRMWQLIFAFESAAVSVVSIKTMQRLLGHAMVACVINRLGMSIFRKLYDFIASDTHPRKLHPSEREECLVFAGIVPLLVADIRKPFADTITCTDASPYGYGICESQSTATSCHLHGRWLERWRFKRLPADQWKPRERSTGWDVLGDIRTVTGVADDDDNLDQYIENDDFPEIPDKLLEPSKWNTVKLGKWRDCSDHITIKEARALLLAVRRLSRSKHNRHKRHLVLLDNLSLCFAVAKGRAHSFDLLRVLQKISAVCLATGLVLRTRWIRSEINVADGPSRGFYEPGPAPSTESSFSSKAAGVENDPKDDYPQGEEQSKKFEESTESSKTHSKEAGQVTACQQGQVLEEEQAVEIGSGNRRSRLERGWEEGSVKSDDNPRAEKREHRDPESVRGLLEKVRGLLEGERREVAAACRRGRCSSSGLHGRALPRQEISKRRREGDGGLGVLQARSEGEVPQEPQSPQGLAKNNASSESTTTAQGPDVWYGDEVVIQRAQEHGLDGPGGLRSLPSSWRGYDVEGKEHPSTSEGGRAPVQVDDSGDQRLRVGAARQSRSVRQCTSFGQSKDGMDRSSPSSACQSTEISRGPSVSLQHGRLQEAICVGGKGIGNRCPSSLSIEARRCIPRPQLGIQGSQWSKNEGALEDRPIGSKVCKNRQSATAADQTQSFGAPVLPMGRDQHGTCLSGHHSSEGQLSEEPWEDVFTMQQRPRRFCLEIFAGTARITSALRKAGLQCFPVDTCIFPSHNVLDISIEHSLQHFIRSGRVQLVWLGMPCTTFSRARRHDGIGPGPLRSSDALWGLPDLRPNDQRKLRDGNALFRFTLRIAALCQSLHIPFVIENPFSSMAWEMPTMRKFISTSRAHECDLDFCMYGENWKKPTKLVHNFLDLTVLNRRCHSSTHICSRTGRPHVPLTGLASNGQFMTLVAQPYPMSLTLAFAEVAAKALRG